MIPRTFLSTYAVNGQQQMVVAFLDNITGLTRWVDYIPVKLAQGGRENSYDNNGFIDVAVVAKSLTSVPFKDYVPVYADTAATDAWQVNFTGYIPYGYAGSGDASLMLDFTSNFQAFDSRITFTRASNATYFNSAGLLTNTSFNALTYSNNLENAAWTKTAATVTANVTTGPFGVVDAEKLVEDTTNSVHEVAQTTASSIAQQQTFSVYAKADTRSVLRLVMLNAGGSARFINFDLAAGTATGAATITGSWTGATASIVSVGNGWYRCILTANSSGTGGISCSANPIVGGTSLYTGDGTSGLFLYGAQLQTGVISAYIPTTTVANSLPRLDYNSATLAAQGLLIEEQRVNLVTYSSDFDNAGWSKTNAAVSANAATSPSGSVDADKLVEDTALSTHFAGQNVTVVSGTSYTFTCYIKSAERTFASIQLGGGGFGNQGIAVNLTTGASTAYNGATSSSVVNAGSGWWRLSVTATASGIGGAPLVLINNSLNGQTYTGDGVSGIYLYGAQLEAGAFATSYAPSVNTFTSRSTTGTFFDSAGVLQSSAINVARNTYNPANLAAQPFLLLEEARTNSIRNNTMVGAVAGTPGTAPTNWFVSSGATLSSQIIGTGTESGITYADIRFFGTNTSGSTQFPAIFFDTNSGIAATPSQTWTESLYLRLAAGTGISFDIAFHELDSGSAFLRSTLVSNGSVTPTAGALSTSRRSGSATTGASTAFVRPVIACSVLNGASIDITLRIGLPQLEQGAFATSVIPTTTTALTRAADLSSSAQATRAADVASVNTLSPWYNASEGTLYAEGTLAGGTAATFPYMTTFVGAAPNSDSIGAQWTANAGVMRFGVRAGGVQQSDLNGSLAKSANSAYKVAGRYATNNVQAAFDGALGTLDTVVTVPTITALSLGGAAGFQPSANTWLRRVTYYPRSLSDAELQSITT